MSYHAGNREELEREEKRERRRRRTKGEKM